MPYKDPAKRREYQRRKYHQHGYIRDRVRAQSKARHLTKSQETADWVRSVKEQTPCSACGESDPRCLDFHHRDPTTKKFCVGRSWGRARQTIELEMTKCVVLCANCHRKLHGSD